MWEFFTWECGAFTFPSTFIPTPSHFQDGVLFGATENARPENAGLENDGQLRKESQGPENAGLANDGQHFCKL